VKTSSWKPGAIARTIISGTSIVLAGFSALQRRIAESGFLNLAVGDWLAVVAKEVYDVDKIAGAFAAGNLTVDNTAGGVFSPGIGDVIARNTVTGKTYRNTAAFTLAAFETGKIVPFEAVEIGTDSNASPGDIAALETVLLGVTVTNASAFVGADEETDPELRVRALAKTGTLSPNGPSDAYLFLALGAKTTAGENAGVNRVRTIPDGAGTVSVYVATPTGAITGTIGDLTTPLGAVDEAIQVSSVPLGVTAPVASATLESIPITYEIWVDAEIGLTAAQIETLIAANLTTYLSVQPIGGRRKVAGSGFLFTDAIEGAIKCTKTGTDDQTIADFMIDLDMTAPAADVSIAATGAPVLDTITATVNLVTQ
jgi:phage-related baseplate assembly protein